MKRQRQHTLLFFFPQSLENSLQIQDLIVTVTARQVSISSLSVKGINREKEAVLKSMLYPLKQVVLTLAARNLLLFSQLFTDNKRCRDKSHQPS